MESTLKAADIRVNDEQLVITTLVELYYNIVNTLMYEYYIIYI